MKFVLYVAIGWCVLLAVAGIALPADPAIEFEVEVLDPLKTAIEYQLEEGNVRVIQAGDMISINGSASEEIWGVPRLVESTKGSVLTLQLIQTWLPAARLDLTVADMNNLAFHLGFVEVLWEASCDAMNEYHTCMTLALVYEFLLEYGTVPEGWPTEPEAWPTDDDEYALRCDPTHSLCRDWVIKVGYENRNYTALPRTDHYEGHYF